VAKTQVNVKLDDELLRKVESLVESKVYASKTEAFTEALKLLLRSQRGKALLQRIDKIREGTETYASASQALLEDHEKEDAQLGWERDSGLVGSHKMAQEGRNGRAPGPWNQGDVFTGKLQAIAPESLLLEVVRALVKIDYPRHKVEETYSTLRETASLGLIEVMPTKMLLDSAKEAEIELGLFASDAIYLATAIIQHTNLLTSDRHLLSKHVLEYAKEQGVEILSLE
jgi:Arc/MetJ-type ribon-helix-helix transcriptional regulator/predicted nucleic acid-binding protein